MSQMSGNQLFNPWKRERLPTIVCTSPKQVSQHAEALIVSVYTKRLELGCSNPFQVCAKHRSKPIHAWMSLASTVDNHNIHPRQHRNAEFPNGIPDYAGALSNAETLLDGDWYIASEADEAECKAKDEADRARALAQNTQDKVGGANQLFTEIVKAANLQAQATSAPREKTHEEIRAEIAALQAKLQPVNATADKAKTKAV